jgi:hypothetical protein
MSSTDHKTQAIKILSIQFTDCQQKKIFLKSSLCQHLKNRLKIRIYYKISLTNESHSKVWYDIS